MFTKGDLKRETILGTQYLVFQPNTIAYAVPTDTPLAGTMSQAQIGIVFHTSYSGRNMQDMKSSFNIDIGRLNRTKDVWFRDASFVDASGVASFTQTETKLITSILSSCGRTLQSISSLTLNRIAASDMILTQIKTFNNTKVRAGEKIVDTRQHTRELMKYVENKLNKEILSAKREDTKRKRQVEKNEVMRFYRTNYTQLQSIFDLMNLVVECKNMVVKKLQEMKQVTNTFLRTDDGYKITNPEGFVAVDRLSGGALKLIDRLEFAHANFNAAKNWDK